MAVSPHSLNDSIKVASRKGQAAHVLVVVAADAARRTVVLSGTVTQFTKGNNGDFFASAGWDACTGLGRLGGQKIASTLT